MNLSDQNYYAGCVLIYIRGPYRTYYVEVQCLKLSLKMAVVASITTGTNLWGLWGYQNLYSTYKISPNYQISKHMYIVIKNTMLTGVNVYQVLLIPLTKSNLSKTRRNWNLCIKCRIFYNIINNFYYGNPLMNLYKMLLMIL